MFSSPRRTTYKYGLCLQLPSVNAQKCSPIHQTNLSMLSFTYSLPFSPDLAFEQIHSKRLYNSSNWSVFAQNNSPWLSLNRRTTVILAYDALLTFSRELDCIWKQKPSAASVIFILQRYGILAPNIIQLVTLCPMELVSVRITSHNE